jgi:hypothetical protein
VLHANNSAKARALLETARMKNPKNPRLWLLSIRVELRADNLKAAQQILAKALQECPNAGILWAQAIAMDPRPLRKSRCADALRRCVRAAARRLRFGTRDRVRHASAAAPMTPSSLLPSPSSTGRTARRAELAIGSTVRCVSGAQAPCAGPASALLTVWGAAPRR